MGASSTEEQAGQREELLEAAWNLATREGLEACTYRGVAAEVGSSPTPVIRHFPTRHDLLLALFERLSQGFDDEREALEQSGDPVATLLAEGAVVLAAEPTAGTLRRASIDLAFEGHRDPAIRKRVRARDRERNARWTALVGEGRDRGLIHDDHPVEEIADQLGSLLDGLAYGTLIYPKRLAPGHMTRLWELGARRLVDPAVVPADHERIVIPDDSDARRLLLGEQKATRRQELLAVAFHVTARDGLSGLSFRALAGEAGTSTTPFTYAFGTREGLLAEMVREIWAGYFDTRALASQVESPVDRFFAEWAGEFTEDRGQVERERVYYEIHHAALTDPEIASLLREFNEHGFDATLLLIEDGREQGLVRDDIPAGDLVDSLYALADGIGLRRGLLGERRPAGYRVALWEDGGRRMLAP